MSYITDLRKHIGHEAIIAIGATTLVFNENGELLLNLRSDTNTWGIPGGSTELSEDVRETATRELREETGLIATELELIDVLSGKDYYFEYPNGDKTCNVIVLFKAIKYSGTLKVSDNESKSLKYFSLDDLPIMESRAAKIIDYIKGKIKKLTDSATEEKYTYRAATLQELEFLWDKNIAENDNKSQWRKWKKQFIGDNRSGKALTFAVLSNDIPIGEGTLLFSPDCNAIDGRKMLADNSKTANINALRIQKAYEGKGHISKLVKEMEQYALTNGFSYLTIGVEAAEARNLAIYLHWGYTELVMSEFGNDVPVLYYRKRLK